MKKVLSLLMILLTLTLVACVPNKIEASSLVVMPEEVSINVGAELQIDVSVLPSDTSDKTLEWTVADTSIATITQTGIIKGIAFGDTTVTIKVKNTPSITKTIPVKVVDGDWPQHTIQEKFGFTLPKFPEYSSIKITPFDSGALAILLAGYVDDEVVIKAYDDLLVADGWVAALNNDNHMGRYTKEGIDVVLSYHNDASHGTQQIEIQITPNKGESTTTWPSELIITKVGYELPVFPGYKSLTIAQTSAQITSITFDMYNPLDVLESWNKFSADMIDAGWIAGPNNNDDGGTFTKAGSPATIWFMASSVKIMIVLQADIHHHWSDFQAAVLEKYQINLPVFDGVHMVDFEVFEDSIEGSAEIEDLEAKLEIFLGLLALDGWVAKEGNNHHLGTYTKDDFEFYYHESHVEPNVLEFVFSMKQAIHTTWPNEILTEKLGFTLPAYPQYSHLMISEGNYLALKIYGITNYEVSLFDYEAILNENQ